MGSLSDNFFYSPLHTRLLIRPVTFQFNFAYLSPRQEQIKLLRGRDDLRAVVPPAAAPAAAPAALSSAATRTPTSVERRLTEPTAVHYPRATDLRGRSWSVGGAVAHCCCLDFFMSMCGTFWCKSGRRPRQRGRKIAKMPRLAVAKSCTIPIHMPWIFIRLPIQLKVLFLFHRESSIRPAAEYSFLF